MKDVVNKKYYVGVIQLMVFKEVEVSVLSRF